MNIVISVCLNVISQYLTLTLFFQVKELPTYKDVDFRNNMQKVYVSDEEKEKIMDKLSRDIEVRKQCCSSIQALSSLTSFVHVCLLAAVSGAYEDHGLQLAAGHP